MCLSFTEFIRPQRAFPRSRRIRSEADTVGDMTEPETDPTEDTPGERTQRIQQQGSPTEPDPHGNESESSSEAEHGQESPNTASHSTSPITSENPRGKTSEQTRAYWAMMEAEHEAFREREGLTPRKPQHRELPAYPGDTQATEHEPADPTANLEPDRWGGYSESPQSPQSPQSPTDNTDGNAGHEPHPWDRRTQAIPPDTHTRTQGERPRPATCQWPNHCQRPVAPYSGTGARPIYCGIGGHTSRKAYDLRARNKKPLMSNEIQTHIETLYRYIETINQHIEVIYAQISDLSYQVTYLEDRTGYSLALRPGEEPLNDPEDSTDIYP